MKSVSIFCIILLSITLVFWAVWIAVMPRRRVHVWREKRTIFMDARYDHSIPTKFIGVFTDIRDFPDDCDINSMVLLQYTRIDGVPEARMYIFTGIWEVFSYIEYEDVIL